MPKTELRYRQIHLDFHTSEAIAGIGDRFDPDAFADTLARAHVNSITCFARCHHGWMYYNTRLFPERRHPHLRRHLLEEQIAACHARDIRVPIYITVQWDHYTANHHPEWLVVDERGCQTGTPPYEAGFYRRLCLNSPYVAWLRQHVQEVLETVPTDGIFFDIVQPQDCSCIHCRAAMLAAGLDPADPVARRAFGLQVVNRFKAEMTAFVRQFNRDCTIFYNAGHIGPRHRAVADAYTHWELESLPSGGWGYMHFPVAMRYARTLGLDCLGMTGKFHTSWGDFHSYKNPAALQFECFQMLALGAKCSVGDQLHPGGALDAATYDLIGGVYREVARKEPWCRGATPLTDIGVLTPEEFSATGERLSPTIMGATRLLQEGAHQFDILDSASDLRRYRVIILPDAIPVSPALADALRAYLADGGALIATRRSGLNPEAGDFARDVLGVVPVGDAPYSPDFVLPQGEIGRGLPETEHVMYLQGVQVQATPDATVLASAAVPYFNRTWQHFCSHRHTPSAGEVGYPAVVQKGRAIYLMHPIFAQYARNAPRWCKQLVLNALDILLPQPLLRLNAPSTTLATVNAQPADNRYVLHLLHYIPERRGQDFDVIEDVIPIYNVGVSLRAERPVRAVRTVPEEEPLPFQQFAGRVAFAVPRVTGHQMVEVQFA